MIVVDASALVAMLLDEPERDVFFHRIGSGEAVISPVGYWEAAIKIGRHRGPPGLLELDTLMSDLGITIAAADDAIARGAVDAEARFGKRTPANLNLGDCFAYALAREIDGPLLFKGSDFVHTDIVPAVPL